MGMVQVGQDLLFIAKPSDQGLVMDLVEDFYGNLALVAAVGTFGQVDTAHASSTQQTLQLIGADLLAQCIRTINRHDHLIRPIAEAAHQRALEEAQLFLKFLDAIA